MSSHKCPATGCKIRLPNEQLMCRTHWFQVPRPLRIAVWNAYQDGAGVGTIQLLRAQQAAVKAADRKIAAREVTS